VIMLLAGCARQSQLVRWDAQRIESTNAREPYTLWENGTQWCKTSATDLQVYVSGFVTAKYLAIAFTLENTSQRILHFYPQECMVVQADGEESQETYPVRPATVDKATRDYLAGSTFLSFLNLAVTGDASASRRIEHDQRTVVYTNEQFKTDLSKNHTLFPGAVYSGILFFPVSGNAYGSSSVDTDNPFVVHIKTGENAIVVRGRVPASDLYDGMESEEEIRQINFWELEPEAPPAPLH